MKKLKRLRLIAAAFSINLVIGILPGISKGQTTTHTFNNTEAEVSGSGRINLIDQPYQKSNTIHRRAHYVLLEKDDNFNEHARAVDSMLRTPKLQLPALEANQTQKRALQPVLFEGNNRVRDFRVLFDHPAEIVSRWRVISAQEDYSARPFKLVIEAGRIKIQYLPNGSFATSRVKVGGNGNTRKDNFSITVTEPMDGIDFDLTDGRFEGAGGPENFDNHNFSIIPAGLVVDSSEVHSGRKLKVSLATRPSLSRNNGLLDGDPSVTPTTEYRQVSVKISSANSLLRFNNQASQILIFDATNWSTPQDVSFTVLGDGNNTVGRNGSDVINIEVDKNQPRHDAFFSNLKETVGVSIPDDDTSPQITSLVIDDGTEQRSVVQSLTVSFDRPVVVRQNAFTLFHQTESVDLKHSQEIVDGRSVVTIQFEGDFTRPSGALIDGSYSFNLNKNNIVDQHNNRLAAGLQTTFSTLFGNTGRRANDNQLIVTVADYNLFRRSFRKMIGDRHYNRIFDWDGRNGVDRDDLEKFRNNLRR